MAPKVCTVSLTDQDGAKHSIEVSAETLYEAVAEAAALMKRDHWVESLGAASRFDVEVRQPAVKHQVSMLQVRRWLDGATKSPNELVRKERLRKLLAS